MFGLSLTIAGTLMHLYVFLRAASAPLVRRRIPRWILVGFALLLWAVFLLPRAIGYGGAGAWSVALEFCGMNWIAALFLTTIALLAVDLATGFGFLFRRFAPSLRDWALIAGATLSVIALIQGMRPPVVRDYEVRLAGLPDEMDGLVLVAMGDLHLSTLIGPRWLNARVAQVQALRPDLVVLLGDIVEARAPAKDELIAGLRRLSAPLGVWAILGNHEFYGRSGEDPALLLGMAGMTVLRNRWAEVRPGLILAGVDDLTTRRRTGSEGDPVVQALAGRPPGATLLLSHTPWEAEKAASAGVGLMLSAHTHGGQIWPFGYLVGLRYPLLAGRYDVEGMTVLVTSGAGTWGPRMRLWRPGEILRVTLRPKKS